MEIIKFEDVESKVLTIRNEQVILDSDVALLYGVETRDINKAVKNNPDKFPESYIIYLSEEEKAEVVENFHHLDKLKYSPHLPKAFTEKGLYMLATILKSPQATATTISIIEAFSKIRELGRNIRALSKIQSEEEKRPLMKRSGELITDIFDSDLALSGTETTIEINFAILKLKHTVKKEKK
ncbi:MAG: ORF6N domain-containing protein [Ignavibacteria bacterium]|jgi:hypothetical protein|nr:ORF6N domain-containing protein [Ignavibacteria bacterium]